MMPEAIRAMLQDEVITAKMQLESAPGAQAVVFAAVFTQNGPRISHIFGHVGLDGLSIATYALLADAILAFQSEISAELLDQLSDYDDEEDDEE